MLSILSDAFEHLARLSGWTDKLTPAHPKSEITDDDFALAIHNAQRLLADSVLLAENGCAKSSIILAVFAIEELGKSLIYKWGVRNIASKREFPTHVEKQAATFAFLSANEIFTKKFRKVERMSRNGKLNFLKIGPHSHQFAWARSGFYDDVRMAATYYDKDPKIPHELIEKVNVGLAKEMHGFFMDAVKATTHDLSMQFAAEIYKNGLGRL